VRILVNTAAENLTMQGDKKRLERVVGNLVDNALVHGGKTEVTVRIARRDGQLHLSVEDEGPGVPPEDAGRIFERFFKADRARQRDDSRGSGLGLAIARENAHLHGGEITLDRANGAGARFMVMLPVGEEEPAS
jgi:signal transduction histidine kinase